MGALSAKDGNNVVQIVTSGLARQRAEKLGQLVELSLILISEPTRPY